MTIPDFPALPRLPEPPTAAAEAALFLDVDGTLLEIAPRSDLVQVPRELPRLLEALADQRGGALALISGRPLAELDRLFAPWHGAAAGIHGSERRRADGSRADRADPAAAAALDLIRPRLAALARTGNGLVFEDKQRSLALHYRAAPERAAEILAVAAALQRAAGASLRLICGKMVVELQPHDADKGAAMAAFMAEPPFLGRPTVFIGDDSTDEDGFAEIERRRGIAVRVGPPADTRARYGLPSVVAVLAWLARSRQPSQQHG